MSLPAAEIFIDEPDVCEMNKFDDMSMGFGGFPRLSHYNWPSHLSVPVRAEGGLQMRSALRMAGQRVCAAASHVVCLVLISVVSLVRALIRCFVLCYLLFGPCFAGVDSRPHL